MDEFVKCFAHELKNNSVLGPGLDESTPLGPLIADYAAVTIHDKVKEAIEEGAELVLGGEHVPFLGPNFFEPTILQNVSPDSRIWKTETFGPVAAIMTFKHEDEAVELANDTRYGLASYFFTTDMSRAFRVSER